MLFKEQAIASPPQMMFFKNLFLLSLVVVLLITEAHAAPKRIFGGEPKNDQPSLTVEEQTSLNRAAAERAESNEDETGDGEENPAKIARGNEMPLISENSSQAAPEGQGEATSSSSNPVTATAPVSFLRTEQLVTILVDGARALVPPTFQRVVLEKLMTLSAADPVFDDGLPLAVCAKLIVPYESKINEMIQNAHQACQRYALDQLPPNVKEKSAFISLTRALNLHAQQCLLKLGNTVERDYPHAFFLMDSMINVAPDFEASIEQLKQKEDYREQANQAQNSGQIEKCASLTTVVTPLHQQAILSRKIAMEKTDLQAKLLDDSSDDSIESSHKIIADCEEKRLRATPIIERQKVFLGRLEEFSPAQQTDMCHSFRSSIEVLNELDAASAEGHEEDIPFLRQQQNAHDQIIKTLLSTNPRVKRLQEKIVEGNKQIASFASSVVSIKAEQRRITSVREGRITFGLDGSPIVRDEFYAPIFELYQHPSSFLDTGFALLQEAQVDFFAGKATLATQKRRLAMSWKDLAAEAAESVNALSQPVIFDGGPDQVLGQNEWDRRDDLIDREEQLAAQAATFPVDRSMLLLPWDFKKTLEENEEALSQEEDN